MPADAVDDRTADDRSERDREPGDAAPQSDGSAAFSAGNASLISVSVIGMTAAAAVPCTARAAISAPTLGDSAAAADAIVNPSTPIRTSACGRTGRRGQLPVSTRRRTPGCRR